jgi:hypothetical protein
MGFAGARDEGRGAREIQGSISSCNHGERVGVRGRAASVLDSCQFRCLQADRCRR